MSRPLRPGKRLGIGHGHVESAGSPIGLCDAELGLAGARAAATCPRSGLGSARRLRRREPAAGREPRMPVPASRPRLAFHRVHMTCALCGMSLLPQRSSAYQVDALVWCCSHCPRLSGLNRRRRWPCGHGGDGCGVRSVARHLEGVGRAGRVAVVDDADAEVAGAPTRFHRPAGEGVGGPAVVLAGAELKSCPQRKLCRAPGWSTTMNCR